MAMRVRDHVVCSNPGSPRNIGLTGTVVMGQDPVKVDPKHYKLESENAQVRILRFQYGPHEKSVMLLPSQLGGRLPDGYAHQNDSSRWEWPDVRIFVGTWKIGTMESVSATKPV